MPPAEVAGDVEIGPTDHWDKNRYDRWPLVVKLSDRVQVEWFTPVPLLRSRTKPVGKTEIAVSDAATIAAALVTPDGGVPFVAVSMYARWLGYHPTTMVRGKGNSQINSDASMHRIISDVSAFVRHHDPSKHRILLAGDMNTFYGAVREGGLAKPFREAVAFDRLDRLGLNFLGPQIQQGRRSERQPERGMPKDTQNVPTYCKPGESRDNARDQLDYVFASRGFHDSVTVRALNEIDEWGSSDHCRLLIEVG